MSDREGRSTVVRPLSPPIPPVVFERFVNPLVRWLLRSPLHFVASDALILVTVTGRRSGRAYTTPVGYEQRGSTLYLTSQTDRTWWRNLVGGADVEVWLRGERRRGHATVIEDDGDVADYVRDYLERRGLDAASRLALSIEGERIPDREALAAGLGEVVVVRIDLDE